MQHKCPMCGCSFSSRSIRRDGHPPSWTWNGTEWTYCVGLLTWTIPVETEQQKAVLQCLSTAFLQALSSGRAKALLPDTSLSGVEGQCDQLKKELAKPQNGLGFKE